MRDITYGEWHELLSSARAHRQTIIALFSAPW